MKWLAGGLTFVNACTVSALLSGMIGHGLTRGIVVGSVIVGFIAAFFAFRQTYDSPENAYPVEKTGSASTGMFAPYRRVWLWLLVAVFAIFAFRSFCWVLFIDNNEFKVQSPNNLGDLSIHLTYINNFASGVPLWPDNPIYVFSKLRYPAGTDLFNAILSRLGIDLVRGLVWTGLLSCVATCFAFYRWGGCFGIAGFLFNGGLIGFQFLRNWQFLDYQGTPQIAWKSIPLTMLVTQRGLLYALPAGLLLLYHWRAKYFPQPQGAAVSKPPSSSSITTPSPRPPLPFWLELSLYATMPLFHAHTFLALTIVLAVIFFLSPGIGRIDVAKPVAFAFVPAAFISWLVKRMDMIKLVACALIPAGFIAWLITDHFHAGSVLALQPGWVQNDGEFVRPLSHSKTNYGALNPFITFLEFWIVNFGFWVPIVIALIAWMFLRAFGRRAEQGTKLRQSTAFVLAASLIFLLAFFVKTAPWGWDNIKIIIWAYFIILPFLWSELLARWPLALRAVVYVALFGSGFVALFGGLKAGRGFGLASRADIDAVGRVVHRLPATARYAAFPTFNHPLLLQGRKVVLGYPGHLWTQGFDFSKNNDKLGSLMLGAPNWKDTARFFQARYLFWGQQEKTNYPLSKRPWEQESKLVATGPWGAIYDLETPRNAPAAGPRPPRPGGRQ